MCPLWVTGDNQTDTRRNREAIIGRLRLPLYDVLETGTIDVSAARIGVALGTSVATHYTVPVGVVAQIQSITLVNHHTVAQAVNVYLVESGGSVSIARQIWADTLQSEESVTISAPWFLAAGDTIRASAAVVSTVGLTAEILQYTGNPSGLVLKVITGVVLGNTATTYYTVPASGVTQALLLSITVCNTDTVSRIARVNKVPDGNSPGTSNIVFNYDLSAKETALDDSPRQMAAGDMVSAQAAVGAVVGARFTVLEVL